MIENENKADSPYMSDTPQCKVISKSIFKMKPGSIKVACSKGR